MKVVVKRVGEAPVVQEIEKDPKTLQDIVGGWLEVIPMREIGGLMLVNEEARMMELPVNFYMREIAIRGDVFFCAHGGDDFTDLSDMQVEFLLEAFMGGDSE